MTLLNKGDAPLYVHIEGRADNTVQTCRIALLDITERKRVEEVHRFVKENAEAILRAENAEAALRFVKDAAKALRLAKDNAEALALEKSQFLVNMSHELRTPMTGMLGMLQLTLEEDLAPVPRDYLETSLRSARSLLRIFNDILDMARLDVGKLTIEEKPFSPHRCITEAVDIITPELRRKGLNFTITLAEEVPETVVGDKLRLRQVLSNLIGNAVKFTDGGKVEVRVTAGKAPFDGKQDVTFIVSDTGIGVPDKKKDFLFRTFSQVDASLSRKYGGTGLGLSISKEIVELMGGTISFVSEEGVGSAFSFTILMRTAGLESDTQPSIKSQSHEELPGTQEEKSALRILLAEDDPVNRLVIGGILRKANYNFDIAEDGLEALEMWEKGGYDLVLMDIQMPHLNGFEATHAIREKEQEYAGHTPIIAMTAHASKDDEKLCLAEGMDAFISKPIDFKLCLKVIEDVIRQTASP